MTYKQMKLPKNIAGDDVKFWEEHGVNLSNSSKYAKWLGSPSEHEDYPGQSLITRNHEVIKAWAEERKATPVTVPGTEHGKNLGVLRFTFPGYKSKNMEPVKWEDFFSTFDNRKLVFLFQEHLKNGNQSNFFKFDTPLKEKE
jgi:hypothetical protein